ncbi:hypothetical protein GCM10027202_17940 [Microvirgula curvata]|uniref:holin n=1 Tax=Microvirgula sp. AG722 TaxID=2183901 RepID=UPI000DC2D311|nr:holin [Microvirgula sp. AG722]RAS14810.1 holin family protein (superfamily II) [Microvirgula sp. AG722]
MRDNALEVTTSTVASKVTYGGAGGTMLGWLLSSEGVALIGLLVAVGGLAVNWYYKMRQDQRDQAEHAARMRELE